MKYKVSKTYPLKQKMNETGIGVRRLAGILGISPSYITRLNKGMFFASEELAKRIMNVFENPNIRTDEGWMVADPKIEEL